MIKTKQELKEYLEADRIAYGKCKNQNIRNLFRNLLFPDRFYKYICTLRKYEYFVNNGKVQKYVYAIKLAQLKAKTGIDLEPNVAGKGLHVSHGKIVVSSSAKIGDYCKILSDVTIGGTGDFTKDSIAPQIGNHVFIGSGARIIGNVKIADNVVVGANSVVNKDILESGITVAGVPARKISDHGSELYIK